MHLGGPSSVQGRDCALNKAAALPRANQKVGSTCPPAPTSPHPSSGQTGALCRRWGGQGASLRHSCRN